MDQVGKVERMKQVILEGVMLNFRHPMIPQMGPPAGPQFPGQDFYYMRQGAPAPMHPMHMPPMGRSKSSHHAEFDIRKKEAQRHIRNVIFSSLCYLS